MAEKTPVRVNYDGSGNPVGFAELQSADFIGLDDGGTGGAYASIAALLTGIGLGTGDSPTFTGLTTSGNVTIGGNLTIDGSTTTVNSTITTLDDPIITLGGDTAPSSDDNKDRGVEFRYHTGSGAKVGFFGFDDSSGKFTFIPDATNSAEVFSGSVGTIVANIEGNVTGTVSSLSGLDSDDLSEGSSNLYFTNERVDDRVNALIIGGSGVDTAYDDAAGTLTLTADLSEITTDLNERVDDRVDSLMTAGSNVSLTYDDAAGTLTIASTDTNTQLTTEQVQDIVGGMVDGGTETNVTVTYDDTNGRLNFVVDQLTSEQVQDIIGPMFASNTETFVSVDYDDSDGTIDVVVPVKDEDNMASDSATHLATQQSIKAYVDSQIQTEESIEDFVGGMFSSNTETFIAATYEDSDGTLDLVVPVLDEDNMSSDSATHLATQQSIKAYVDGLVQTEESIEDFVGGMVTGNTETLITVTYDDSDGTMDFVVDNDLANYDNSTSGFITATLTNEQVQDIVGAMFSSNTETNIAVTYDDSDGTIDLVSTDTQLTAEQVQDIVGAMFSSNTETNITATYEDGDGTIDLVADLLTEEAVEDFVNGMIVGGTNVTATYDDAAGTLTLASTDTNTQLTQEQVEDYVGGMVSGTQTFITVAYDDTGGDLTYVVPVKDEDNMASDSATHLATQQSIKAYVDAQIATEDTLAEMGDVNLTSPADASLLFYDTSTSKWIDNVISGDATIADTGVLTIASGAVDNAMLANSSITVTDGSNSTATSLGGTITFSGTSNEVEVAESSGTITIGLPNDVTIAGDLTVNGTTTEVESTTVTINDPLVRYADNNSGNSVDFGWYGKYVQSATTKYAGLVWDASASDKFRLWSGNQAEPTTTVNTSGTGHATGTLIANIEGNVTGNVTGNTSGTAATVTGAAQTSITSLGTLTALTVDNVVIDGAVIGHTGDTDLITLSSGVVTVAGEVDATSLDISGDADIDGTLEADAITIGGTALNTVIAGVTVTNATTAASATALAATTITGLTAETSIHNDDLVLIYDDSASALRKMTKANFVAGMGAGSMENFTLTGDSGSNQTISDGETLDIAGGTGIDTVVGSTDTVTVNIDATVATLTGSQTLTNKTLTSPVLNTGVSGSAIKDEDNMSSDSATHLATQQSIKAYVDNASVSSEQVQDIVGAMFTGNTETNITVTYEDGDGTIDLVATGNTTEQIQDIVGAMFSSNTETNITATYEDGDGTIDLVADLLTEEAVEDYVNGLIVAGANITKTYDDAAGTLTIAATGGAANAFSTIAVSGQSNVVADASTDTLTLAAGTGMTIATNASSDTITFTSSGGGGGTMPFTEYDGSTDNIILSSAATAGSLPVTLAGGSSDPIAMTATQQTLTSYADADDDTKIEVERSTDNDTVYIKAGGTDVITATSSGVTITNLTVSGTSTQANELKITDTLFELNADGGSLTTDAGMIVERGSTGDNAALIWDESVDAWVAGTTATDGSASSNLTVTEGDFKAKTQNQSDNSTKVATTAYVDTALGGVSSNSIGDADSDTKIQVEEGSDEDIIRADTAGQERFTVDNNVSMSARGGFFTHNATLHASETFTIASTEGTVAAGPLDVQGTVDVQGTLVVV